MEKSDTVLCRNCGTFNTESALWCKNCGQELSSISIRILPKGTELDGGRYVISGYVGHGGSAITYKARQRNFTSEIAIREYYPSALAVRDTHSFEVRPIGPEAELSFDQGKTQFLFEGNNLRTLGRVPNLIQVHAVFEDNGTVYMAEDYIGGESLAEILDRKKRFSFKEAMTYVEPLMRALMQVHSYGIIHRDIKPANIIISENIPYLIDFGISKRIIRNTTRSSRDETHQDSGSSAFTRGFAAPEQITGRASEAAWTDVYGIAATLYKMVTGNDPDDAEARLVNDLLPPPIDLRADLTRKQSDAIMKGLALDTVARFQNMREFLTELTAEDQIYEGQEAQKDPGVIKEEENRHIFRWIIPAAIIVLLFIMLWKNGKLPFSGSSSDDDQKEETQEDNQAEEEAPENEIAETPEQDIPGEGDEGISPENIEEIPRTISINSKILDLQGEVLGGYSVRVSQIFTGTGQTETTKLLYSGKTDSFGWLAEIGAEDADGFIRYELQETGNRRDVSIRDIELSGGYVELSFPFHLYPETYNYGGHTYAVGSVYDASDLNSYNKVKAYCESLGGHLAVINNAGEDAFLYRYFCVPGVSTVFFGYTDQDEEGKWKWAYGNSDYTNWTRPGAKHPGPDNGNGPSGWGPENYAEYNSGDDAANDGTWNDAKFAVNTSSYIIEWEFERPEKY